MRWYGLYFNYVPPFGWAKAYDLAKREDNSCIYHSKATILPAYLDDLNSIYINIC